MAPTTASAQETAPISAESKNTLEVTAGSLNLSGTTDETFASTTVKDIHDAGYQKSITQKPVVEDYRGGDGVWELSVASDGVFAKELGATLSIADAGSAHDAAAVSATLGAPTDAEDLTSAQKVATTSGANGENDLNYTVNLSIPAGTNAAAGSYTDTLTWTLATPVEQ